MIYDPNNELTDEQLEKLGNEDFDSMLEYLDGQAEYLKKFTKPLSSYHTKDLPLVLLNQVVKILLMKN